MRRTEIANQNSQAEKNWVKLVKDGLTNKILMFGEILNRCDSIRSWRRFVENYIKIKFSGNLTKEQLKKLRLLGHKCLEVVLILNWHYPLSSRALGPEYTAFCAPWQLGSGLLPINILITVLEIFILKFYLKTLIEIVIS